MLQQDRRLWWRKCYETVISMQSKGIYRATYISVVTTSWVVPGAGALGGGGAAALEEAEILGGGGAAALDEAEALGGGGAAALDEAEALGGGGAAALEETGVLRTVEEGTIKGTVADELAGGAAGELGGGAAIEVNVDGTTVDVTGGATHRVQIVETLVTLIVDTLKLVWTIWVVPELIVAVTGQIVVVS